MQSSWHTILDRPGQGNQRAIDIVQETLHTAGTTGRIETMRRWSLQLNAAVGSLVATCGLWLIWGDAPVIVLAVVALMIGFLLSWASTSLAAVWAWTTGLLGLESLAWPIVTMAQIKMAAHEPTEEEMGAILISMLFGLFSSIFWLTFSYGIFKRFVYASAAPSGPANTARTASRSD